MYHIDIQSNFRNEFRNPELPTFGMFHGGDKGFGDAFLHLRVRKCTKLPHYVCQNVVRSTRIAYVYSVPLLLWE